jgi:hypothetical protein
VLQRDDFIGYDNPAVLRWTLAEQQLRTLHDCTLVDLNQLAAHARAEDLNPPHPHGPRCV